MEIVEELGKEFDVAKIEADIQNVIFKDPAFSMEKYDAVNQIALHDTPDWFNGTGSLYDYDKREFVAHTKDFLSVNPKLKGTYLFDVIKTVKSFATSEGYGVGRIRIMRMMPKTCLTLHKDLEEFRYHIPLVTTWRSFFVVETSVYRMPHVGKLYRFNTDQWHTAVNASGAIRIHLLFDTWKL